MIVLQRPLVASSRIRRHNSNSSNPGSELSSPGSIEPRTDSTGSVGPDAVTSDGASLTKAASFAVLQAVASGYAFEASKTGGTVWIKLPAGKHAVVIDR